MVARTVVMVAVILVLAPPGRGHAQDSAHFLSAADLRARVANPVDGVAGGAIPTGPGATVLLARRTRSGDIEVHTKLSDEIIVQDGKAAILVGGRVENNHEVSPGEWRGGAMSGAKRYDMSPGDVLWIPAGAPHQVVVPDGGSFIYFAVKFEAKSAPQP